MDELEQPFVDFLERSRGGENVIEIRVSEIKDALGEQFISQGLYKTSQVTAAVTRLVKKYRGMRRLRRIAGGVYEYALKPDLLLSETDENLALEESDRHMKIGSTTATGNRRMRVSENLVGLVIY